MKPKNSFIILIPLYSLLLIILVSFSFFSDYMLNQYYKKISTLPVLAYSYEIRYLINLQTQFETDTSVIGSSIIPADKLKKELIDKYDISNNELSQNSRLPNLLIINSKAKSKVEYLSIVQNIRKTSGNILIDYNSNSIDAIFREVKIVKMISSYLLYVFAFLTILIIYFSRIFYEFKNNEYWKIYVRAGGNIDKRRHLFFMNNLVLYFVPLLIASAFFVYVYHYYNQSPDLNDPDLLVIIIAPIISMIFAKIYLRREL